MANSQIASVLIMVLMLLLTVLGVLIIAFIIIKIKSKKQKSDSKSDIVSDKTKVQQLYSMKSIFNFMEFDRIEDNMIVQKKGKRFLMVVKCQGINYDLMSGIEKNSVEQGFIQFLNALRYPIQLYIQTRKVDLTGSLTTYRQKIEELGNNLAEKEYEYNQKVRSGQYDKQELNEAKMEVIRARNLYDYGADIVGSTEKMNLNKNILTKQYYVVLSYYSEEMPNDLYGQEEINNMAFSELYTRAQSTVSLLSVCGITGKVLDSEELAELLYNAYNREDAETYDLDRAIQSGYDSLYTTAQDVLEKKMKELDKQIEIDAIQKANQAIYEAKQQSDLEKKVKQKEKEYDDLVAKMAALILENNADLLEKDVVDKAKENIENKGITEIKSKGKEEKVNEQEKVKRARRPRKSA